MTVSSPRLPGIFRPSSENGSPSPPGIQFSSPPGLDSHRTDFRPSSPPCQTVSARNKRSDNRQRDSPARTATVPLRAARRLSPACRKNRPVPTPSFYGRVNNFEDFSGLRGPAYLSVAVRLIRTGDRPPKTTRQSETRDPTSSRCFEFLDDFPGLRCQGTVASRICLEDDRKRNDFSDAQMASKV